MLTHSGPSGRYLDLNGIEYFPEGDLSSAHESIFLLEHAFSCGLLKPRWGEIVSHIRGHLGPGNTVWGIKNQQGRFFLECYFYYPQWQPAHTADAIISIIEPFVVGAFPSRPEPGSYQCISVDIDGDHISGLNVYRLDRQEGSKISASSWFLSQTSETLRPMNKYHSFLSEPGFHVDGFHFSDSTDQIEASFGEVFPGIDFKGLSLSRSVDYLIVEDGVRHPVGVAEKSDAVGLYFMGLEISDFIKFLKHYSYPDSFVGHIEDNEQKLAHMRYDIGVDYRLSHSGLDVVKTAFFGSM